MKSERANRRATVERPGNALRYQGRKRVHNAAARSDGSAGV